MAKRGRLNKLGIMWPDGPWVAKDAAGAPTYKVAWTLNALMGASNMVSIRKNVGSQQLIVYAFDTSTGADRTGDELNLSCKVSKDGGSLLALATPAATELEDGMYSFQLSQAETNADVLTFAPESSTASTKVFAMPSNRIYTANMAGTLLNHS